MSKNLNYSSHKAQAVIKNRIMCFLFIFCIALVFTGTAFSQAVFINEVHYDNTGGDTGEFIEVAGPPSTDMTGWSLELYNGSNGTLYNTIALSGTLPTSCAGLGVVSTAISGIQNGSPDGIALIDDMGVVTQFLSYEGSLTATNGTANGMTSSDIGVSEPGSTPVGQSLQLSGTGSDYTDFTWNAPAVETPGSCNTGQLGVPTSIPFINEVHYDNTGGDVGEFIEIGGSPGTDLTGWSIVLYNGSNGTSYSPTALSGTLPTSCPGLGVQDTAISGIQNGSPDGVALVDDTNTVIQFLSYEGSFTATNGPANGMTSTDIGVSEPGGTPVGQSLQLIGTGIDYADFTWTGPIVATPGACNTGQFGPGGPPPPQLVINEFHADPDAVNGDANGDGSVDATQDEFVEIINTSGGDLDVSGWTIADGFGLRHTFPIGTILADQCGVVVFGGGTPTGTFGNVITQVASSGAIGLNNGGDDIIINDGLSDIVTVTYGAEGGNNQSLTLDPDLTGMAYVEHSTATGSGGSLYSPGTQIDGSNFAGCMTGPITGLVINEFQADPDGSIDGDANGDGTRNGSEDEFFEMVNNTGADLDVSGWTMSDAVNVRHIFPAGSVIPDQCSLVVFGGGTPTGNFGYSLVQLASSGSVGLNNGGDTITINDGMVDQVVVVYGSEGGNNQSLTLDPDISGMTYVEHSSATGSGGSLYSPGTRIDGTPFSGCPVPDPLTINELQADPDAVNGDANGDGNSDTSQDEFVELVNTTGATLDVSGWTISDAAQVRHTFPAGTMVADQCTLVVFGGGTPTGDFENSIVQVASTGALGLNNGGDTITVNDGMTDITTLVYGVEGGNNQSITRDPDITGGTPLVQHSTATGSAGALFSPGTLIDGSSFIGCIPPPVAFIHEIQGSGAASPFAGMTVTTNNNIVTAVGPEGFTIQSQDADADADPQTSEGIYVFTGSAPTVTVGDMVDLTGDVVEFFDFTEFTNNPVITVTSSGNPLPTAVVFDANTPSPIGGAPSCGAGQLECFESMLVQMSGTTTSPSQSFGSDPIAEPEVVVGNQRALRETGIEFPGIPGLPLWDGNPEIFELDPDRLGQPNRSFNTGVQFDATGVIGFDFGDYELWPTSYNVTQEVALPIPVRAPVNGEMTIGSLNMYRFFDDIDDPADGARDDIVIPTAEYGIRRAKFVNYIRDVLGNPDILAVEEVESIVVLNDLAADILADSGVVYTAQLIEGNDIGTIDVGFLLRDTVSVNAVTQLGAAEINTFDGSILHDRPPLLLEASYNGNGMPFDVGVFVIHSRSLSGIDDSVDGPRVRSKRLQQAQSIATMAQSFQTNNANVPMILVGDFNAFEFTDGYVDFIGQIRGLAVPADNLLSDTNITNPPLSNQVLSLPAGDRHSFNFRGSSQVLDHALTSIVADVWVRGFAYGVGNKDGAEIEIDNPNSAIASSDHDGFVLFMMTDFDADSIPDDLDNCPVNANLDQSDVDMDGIGDVCDPCDATADSVFSVTGQTINQISGTVEQCAGVNSVVLDVDAVNISLGTTGNAGDPTWNFVIDLTDPTLDGSTSLVATGTINPTTSMLFSLVGDFDSDLIPDDLDNCPLVANADQADFDMDGIGDACDTCDATLDSVFSVTGQTINQISGTVQQCAGINSVVLDVDAVNVSLGTTGNAGDSTWTFVIDLIDPTLDGSTSLVSTGTINPTTSMLFSLVGDFDSDLIPDNLDNCPLNANPDQSDIDMDGIGDVCDTCDSTTAAIFTITDQNPTQIIGTVEQCAGINSVVLAAGSTNMFLTTTGAPGDSVWNFVLELSEPLLDGSAALIAQGVTDSTTSSVYSLVGVPPVVIPSLNFVGILIMMLLLLLLSGSQFARFKRT